jgi:FixJ family two-component response regulator
LGKILGVAQPATHVAIVDDDASVCRALARLLRTGGFAVDTYVSAHDFLGSLTLSIPDCLIVDLRMPEMTGLELHEQLVRTGFYIPTILITAYGDDATCEQARNAGVDDCLEKPLQEPSLLAAINAATGRTP